MTLEERLFDERLRQTEATLRAVVSVLLSARGPDSWPLINAQHKSDIEKALNSVQHTAVAL